MFVFVLDFYYFLLYLINCIHTLPLGSQLHRSIKSRAFSHMGLRVQLVAGQCTNMFSTVHRLRNSGSWEHAWAPKERLLTLLSIILAFSVQFCRDLTCKSTYSLLLPSIFSSMLLAFSTFSCMLFSTLLLLKMQSYRHCRVSIM